MRFFTQRSNDMAHTEEDHLFALSGEFAVSSHLKPIFAGRKNTIIGFELPDGRKVKLIVGLELENEVNGDYDHITSAKGMQDLGFGLIDYHMSSFEPKGV
jgi:hypothetical protein